MNFNVKITCDEECRRFAFSKQETFANFVQTVKNLFGKTEEQLNVLYLDDEKEWVKISTELEWTHLVQNIPVFNNALRVRVGADKAKKPISRCERAKAETSTSPKRAFKCRKGGERLPFLHQIMQQISQFKPAEVSTTNNNSAASASTGSEQNGGYKVGTMFNEVLAALSNLQGKPQEEVKTQPQEEKLENQAQPQPQVQPEQFQEREVPQPAPVEAVVHVEAPAVEEVVVKQEAEVPQVEEPQPVEQEPVIFQQAPAEFHDLVVAPPAPAPAAEQTAVVYPPVFVQEEQPAVKQPEPEPYSHELVSLEMMGFSNKALNLHLLKHFKGDMAKAIDSLLNM